MGLFKSRQVAKITACYSHFASCSRVCPYAHTLSEGQYSQLISVFSCLYCKCSINPCIYIQCIHTILTIFDSCE